MVVIIAVVIAIVIVVIILVVFVVVIFSSICGRVFIVFVVILVVFVVVFVVCVEVVELTYMLMKMLPDPVHTWLNSSFQPFYHHSIMLSTDVSMNIISINSAEGKEKEQN